MSADRPHARHAAAARKRKRQRSAAERLLPVLIPLAVVVVAGAIAVLVVAGGGSDAPPAPGSPEQIALGEDVFGERCATCHGEGAAGGLAGPPLTHELYRDLTDDDIRAAIAQGVPPTNWPRFEAGMSPVPDLAEHEVAAVIEYVRARQAEAWGAEP